MRRTKENMVNVITHGCVGLYALIAGSLYINSLLGLPKKAGFMSESMTPKNELLGFILSCVGAFTIFMGTCIGYYYENKKYQRQLQNTASASSGTTPGCLKSVCKDPALLLLSLDTGVIKSVIPAYALFQFQLVDLGFSRTNSLIIPFVAMLATLYCQYTVIARKTAKPPQPVPSISDEEALRASTSPASPQPSSCRTKAQNALILLLLGSYATLNPFLYFNQSLDLPRAWQGTDLSLANVINPIWITSAALNAIMGGAIAKAYFGRVRNFVTHDASHYFSYRHISQLNKWGLTKLAIATLASLIKTIGTSCDVLEFGHSPAAKLALLAPALIMAAGIFVCEFVVFYHYDKKTDIKACHSLGDPSTRSYSTL